MWRHPLYLLFRCEAKERGQDPKGMGEPVQRKLRGRRVHTWGRCLWCAEASLKLWSESTSVGLARGAAHTRGGSSEPISSARGPDLRTCICVEQEEGHGKSKPGLQNT